MILALAPAELVGSLLLLAVAVAIATRGAWLIPDPPPVPPRGTTPPRSAVTLVVGRQEFPARHFDWHQDDPDISDYAARLYAVCAAYDVPPGLVGLWPGPPRRS